MIKTIAYIQYDAIKCIIEIHCPPSIEPAIKKLIDQLNDNPANVQISKWHRTRSTGPHSQNRAINGFIQQIAQETGNDFETVKTYCKTEAISAGYPFDTLRDIVIPWSETRLDTVQASILIDTIHRLAAEEGIRLKEED
jgi:hypothetical protein